MHLILTLVHMELIVGLIPNGLYLESARLLAVIMQVLNFILMAQMWVFADSYDEFPLSM